MNKNNIVDALISDVFNKDKNIRITYTISMAVITINNKEITMENGQVIKAKHNNKQVILTSEMKRDIKKLLML